MATPHDAPFDQKPQSSDNDTDTEVDDEIEEDDLQQWEDWRDGHDDGAAMLKCLFCNLEHISSTELFEHCQKLHHFNFSAMRRDLELSFYDCFKLINYVRSQVANNSCWQCQVTFSSNKELLNHCHPATNAGETKHLWVNDENLKPFLEDDPLLYSFDEIEDGDDQNATPIQALVVENDITPVDDQEPSSSLINLTAKNVVKVNEDYFSSYSSFGIHREMLSDKGRMAAYTQAISENPILLKNATVVDVGCGTGVLSLLAAKAGASRVIAVEASTKMASVATQIACDNGYSDVVNVVEGMIEELTSSLNLQPNSADVLISEWMGYCLLYESMLPSVLFARDRWLKPGGAILPDIATMHVAGFGKESTSLCFWENVHGFNMSSIGKELLYEASKSPIVDVVDSSHLVTYSAVLHRFDLATMKSEEVDFTAEAELVAVSKEVKWCYGVVLWFETLFSERFCKESPAVLSTSPDNEPTHWSQTVFTFREPMAVVSEGGCNAADGSPAVKLGIRVSIVRAVVHRSIDVSVEVSGITSDGRKFSRPAQMFNLS